MGKREMRDQILVYAPGNGSPGGLPAAITLVSSPLTCLSEATGMEYDLIALFCDYRSPKEREDLINLCGVLKMNPHTRHIPQVSLLPGRNRIMLERFQDAGVDYVRFYDPKDFDLESHVEGLAGMPAEDCGIGRILSAICPYITYSPAEGEQEVVYCGAYRNRLILGSRRLQEECETADHRRCHYYEEAGA